MAPRSAAPATADERRDASLSFGDQESIVYQALLAHLGDDAEGDDGYVDVWITDLSTDWVVWHAYSDHPGPGYWRLSYSETDGTVVFDGEPEQVVEQTTYVPVEAKKPARVPAAPARRSRRDVVPVATREQRQEVRSQLRNVRETRRALGEFELREVANGTGGTDILYSGFACVTNAEYEMEDWLGPWTESVTPGAFRKTLAESADAAFLLNHEGMTLARTKPGTLQLSEVTAGDVTGLFSEARLDGSNLFAQALRSAVERGDIDEMSFAFRVVRQEWDEDFTERWINEVNLDKGDVSAVNYGANPHTAGTVAVRSAQRAAARLGMSGRSYVAALRELREGKTLSTDTLATLQQVLDLVSSADDAVDEAQVTLSELMGVPNPDDEDETDRAADDDATDKGGDNTDGNDDDESNLSAKAALEVLAMPNHLYDAKRRLAALRG